MKTKTAKTTKTEIKESKVKKVSVKKKKSEAAADVLTGAAPSPENAVKKEKKAAPAKKAAKKTATAHEAEPKKAAAKSKSVKQKSEIEASAASPVKAEHKAAHEPVTPAKATAAHPPKHEEKISHPSDAQKHKVVPVHADKPHHPAPAIEKPKHVQPEVKINQAPAQAPSFVKTTPTPAPIPAQKKVEAEKVIKGTIKINETITLRDLSDKMNIKPADMIKKLLTLGTLATINQRIPVEVAAKIAGEFCYAVQVVPLYAVEESMQETVEDPSKLKSRAPVVTIMGHVDHGKTSLLDAIRKSKVTEGEAGGITQHIGAYKVKTPTGQIAFLDTPGHEAFTAMRSRGAKATDIVVLVVSATDGIMPQTVEAIDHAKAAQVPIIVAINKIDLPTANAQQIKQELGKYNLLCEEWGGDTITVEVSAKKGTNIDSLLEMILLKAEIMELKSNPDKLARGVVIEAKLDHKRGSVATVLIHSGTLRVGDNFVAGVVSGKIRAMIDDHGHRMIEAGPSTPVEILGITNPPQAGDPFIVVKDEREAREISISRQTIAREDSLRPRHHLSLEDISAGKTKELRVILKTDMRGSLEAIKDSIDKLSTSSINLKLVHGGVGSINESDITLAAASDALIIGFNIRPDSNIQRMADHEGVSIRTYRIIYEIINDVKAAMEGLLDPELKEVVTGKAAVKQVFKVTKGGMIAGSMVIEGKITRSGKARVLRDNIIVYEGSISNLKRFKDDVREVEKGFECGISMDAFQDVRAGDILEFFVQEKIARKLENS